jgi:hypothetical protein
MDQGSVAGVVAPPLLPLGNSIDPSCDRRPSPADPAPIPAATGEIAFGFVDVVVVTPCPPVLEPS